ncbi:high frequency lysogenization protein HflD [Spongiibacter sp. KMU-158]|uniref:High frequency lysogenization protein HflD homolog n=1 Tax=Spongiibacter pelagi TaxID=2760804 RepID=A0A927C0Y7_9GAMM|nr:high frequency lysogenization protein HflD [Spongiibacter pelagi]MBD2859245.1 high frequency lysogenization protein HflD [Spongiibacter pelagi]
MNAALPDKNAALRQQTLALAAIVQSTHLVDQIARTGQADPAALEASLESLFITDAENPEQAFNGVSNLAFGLRSLRDLLSGNDYGERQSILRYCLGVLHLQRKLSRDNDTAAVLRSRLEHTHKQREFTEDLGALCSSLGGVYTDTLSKYKFRIQITGSAQQLQNPNNANRIRALLLAAIRATYLWRQSGGSRLGLLMRKNAYYRCASTLLNQEILH